MGGDERLISFAKKIYRISDLMIGRLYNIHAINFIEKEDDLSKCESDGVFCERLIRPIFEHIVTNGKMPRIYRHDFPYCATEAKETVAKIYNDCFNAFGGDKEKISYMFDQFIFNLPVPCPNMEDFIIENEELFDDKGQYTGSLSKSDKDELLEMEL